MSSFNVLVDVTIALVFFGTGDAIPDITLTGVKIKRDNGASVHQLKCSTTNVFHGCAVEFLLNRKTIKSIRYANKTCYTGEGVCYSVHCACSDGCDAFSFNYTNIDDKEHQIFECDTTIKDKRIIYRANASGSFVGDEFVVFGTTVTMMSGAPFPSQNVTAKTVLTEASCPKEQQICNDRYDIIIALSCFGCLNFIINCVLLGGFVWICFYQRKKNRKTSKDKVLKRRLPRKQNRKTYSEHPQESINRENKRLIDLAKRENHQSSDVILLKRVKPDNKQFDVDTTTTTDHTDKINGRPSIHPIDSEREMM